MPRTTSAELAQIARRKGYGVSSSLGRGIASRRIEEKLNDKACGEGEMSDVERGARPASIRPKDLTIPYSGRCTVRLKVFRQRLTDTGNDCWKYHLDACRYLGWLADDDDATIRLEEEPHEKVKSKDEERVEITLEFDGLDLDELCAYYASGPKNTKREDFV